MSYTSSDPSGGYFDPVTGMYIPGSAMPTKQQATQPNAFNQGPTAESIGNATKGAIETVLPALQQPPVQQTNPAIAPPQSAQAQPQQAPQAAPQAPVASALNGPDPYAKAPSPASQPMPAAPVATALTQPATPPANASSDASAPRDYSGLVTPIVDAESGGNANAKNPNSSARGLGQFLDSTWQQFINSPANTGKWTMDDRGNADANKAAIQWYAGQNNSIFQSQLGRPATNDELFASHLLGGAGAAALAKSPDANAYDTLKAIEPNVVDQVFAGNGKVLQKGMTGAQALASVSGFYTGKGPAPVNPGTAVAQATPAQAAATPATPAYDPNTDPAIARLKAMMQFAGVHPMTTSDKLLAMASGFLGGNGPAKSLAGGLGAVPQMNLEANKQAMQLAQMGIESQYHDALIQNGVGRLGIQQQNATTNAGRLTNAQIATQQRFNPATAASLAQSKTAANESQKDIDAIMNSQTADERALQDTQQAQALISQNPGMMGPTLAARATRSLAEMGIAGDANTLNALQKMTADQRNAYLSTVTGGHVGGIRSNQELKNLSQAVADVNTSPQAAQYILQSQNQEIQARQAWRQELRDRFQNDPDSITGRQYSMTKSQFFQDYYKQHPLPDYNPGGQPASPNAAPAPGTTANGGTKGVSGTTSSGVSWTVTPQ